MPTLDLNITQTQEFMQLWLKYYDIYNSIINKKAANRQDEELFLDTKRLLNKKYSLLKKNLKLAGIWDDKSCGMFEHILALPGILALSDERLSQLEGDWKRSLLFLNGLLADLQKDRSQRPKSRIVRSIINNALKG